MDQFNLLLQLVGIADCKITIRKYVPAVASCNVYSFLGKIHSTWFLFIIASRKLVTEAEHENVVAEPFELTMSLRDKRLYLGKLN
jgi:hypothetical protein